MTSYEGIDVLEERLRRKFVLLDGSTGIRQADEQSPAPAPARPFTWTAFGRAEMAAMRDFLDARAGRAEPFWFPSYQWDLRLAADLDVTETIATIQWVRYGQQMFGSTGGRRHVAFWNLGLGQMDYYRIVDSTDPGDEIEESITLDPGAVRDYGAAQTVISFLKLCRLDTDLTEISYPSTEIAQATIMVRELPMEAPV
jgi:hypothetical protein